MGFRRIGRRSIESKASLNIPVLGHPDHERYGPYCEWQVLHLLSSLQLLDGVLDPEAEGSVAIEQVLGVAARLADSESAGATAAREALLKQLRSRYEELRSQPPPLPADSGDELLYVDRRFVLGRGLRESSSFKTFQPAQLGLAGSLQVQIPKSINRLRLKGSGSRFVHGGATLQEVVIPIISINKKRQSDVGRVDVELIGGGGKTITTGQLAVVLYQTEPVTDKRQPRRLRVGLYTLAGELISDVHELRFDMSSANPREREVAVRFILSRKADDCNNQQVELRLEEPVDGTSQYSRYHAARYTIRRSFTSEFDF